NDGSSLVWDLATAPAAPLAKDAGDNDITAWWADLAAEDAARAYAAVWRLTEAREKALPFLREHLKPVAEPDPAEVARLVADLNSDLFRVREKAFRRLEGLGGATLPALRTELQKGPPPEARCRLEALLSCEPNPAASPETLRRLRALQVLERMGYGDARKYLGELAGGAAEAPETREAKAALERLAASGGGPRCRSAEAAEFWLA